MKPETSFDVMSESVNSSSGERRIGYRWRRLCAGKQAAASDPRRRRFSAVGVDFAQWRGGGGVMHGGEIDKYWE